MYNIGDIGGLYAFMPPNMQNAKTDALCYAVERQAKRISALLEKLNVWSDLENVRPEHYDYVATCLRAMYYRSELTNEQKLAVLKSTLMTYRYAGSVRAIEELLNNLFSEAEFIPWYEYGGKPYHFKISASGQPDQETKRMLKEILKKVKAARSVIDAVEIKTRTMTAACHIGLGMLITDRITIKSGQ